MASQRYPASIAGAKTETLPTKPAVAGIPPIEIMKSASIEARNGDRSPSPWNSSKGARSAFGPATIATTVKAPTSMNAYVPT